MSVRVDPSSTFFAWKFHHPHESEDMQAVWGAAWKAGGRAAMQDSSRLVDLGPLLLDLLEDGQVEDLVGASDRRPRPEWDDGDECQVAF